MRIALKGDRAGVLNAARNSKRTHDTWDLFLVWRSTTRISNPFALSASGFGENAHADETPQTTPVHSRAQAAKLLAAGSGRRDDAPTALTPHLRRAEWRSFGSSGRVAGNNYEDSIRGRTRRTARRFPGRRPAPLSRATPARVHRVAR